MHRYLAELHKKPDHHKKQFALLASGTITLIIFGVWSLATFGASGSPIAKVDDRASDTTEIESEVGPFQSLSANVATSLEALKNIFGALMGGVKAVDLDSEYQKMRDGALNTYDQ